ncbi:Holliday junction branch migration protein RuvA [Candidatus Kaiserbacteria bacterium]|nr:Holliday junction branch migration protein RuvA [Candidatus Kaiserbacteria bacterium]USN92587.1 MAG: Holliday junction branch migration protein RuvA [Candidatus Nomurabacteria bacterium]
MIRSLAGKIKDVGDGWIVISVNNIGYLVSCLTATENFKKNQEITLHTYLAVRENALDLYGFINKVELEMFELILCVPKIGPKSALQVLSQATPTLLIESAHKNDGAYLHKLSGIGKKTCENIVQYLHGKLEKLPATIMVSTDSLSDMQTDAIDALVSLGYDMSTARDIVVKISDENSTVNSLVTQALKQIR